MFQTGLTRIQPGQNIYNSLAEAESAILTRSFVVETNIAANGITRAYVILRNSATSLQNINDAKIIETTKFGGVASGGVSLSDAAIIAALGFTPENVANKQNSLAVDGTGVKFPTVDAINGEFPKTNSIYALGNSLTSDGRYETQLQTNLGTTWTVVNKGIAGATSTQIAYRLKTDVIDNQDAKYVIILAGINDVNQDVSSTTIKANLQAMYTEAFNAGIKVVAVTLLPFKTGPSYTVPRQAVLDDVNAWILATAINVDYKINAFPILEDPANPDALLPAYSGDGLHLSSLGYQTLANYIYSNVTWTNNFTNNKIEISGVSAINQDTRTFSTPKFQALNLSPNYDPYNTLKSGINFVDSTGNSEWALKHQVYNSSGVKQDYLAFFNKTLNSDVVRFYPDGTIFPLGNITPNTDAIKDLGEGGRRWRDLYLSRNLTTEGIFQSYGSAIFYSGFRMTTGAGVDKFMVSTSNGSGTWLPIDGYAIKNQYTSAQVGQMWINGNIKAKQIFVDLGFGVNFGADWQIGNDSSNYYLYNNTLSSFAYTVSKATNKVTFFKDLTLSQSPTTSIGTYDILTRNTSTGVVEKKLNSDFLHAAGDETKTGNLTITNPIGGGSKLLLNNNNTSTDASLTITSNTSTSVGSQTINTSSGIGVLTSNNSSGIGNRFENISTGKNVVLNNSTAATGTPFSVQKNSIDKLTILDNGIIMMGVFTVATLPTPTTTAYATVTDALAPAYLVTVVGGGAVSCPVFYNGTNWVSH